jgi:hypothetical protein
MAHILPSAPQFVDQLLHFTSSEGPVILFSRLLCTQVQNRRWLSRGGPFRLPLLHAARWGCGTPDRLSGSVARAVSR